MCSCHRSYWLVQRAHAAAAASSHLPFCATTTYQREVGEGEATAAQQLLASQGIPCTLVGFDGARKRR